MSEHSLEEVEGDIKKYLKVFAALLIFTVATVTASYLNFGVAVAVCVGLAIAIFKGTLVAGFFMHLFGEKKIIFLCLTIMVIFFFVLLFLPVLTWVGRVGT